MHRDGTPPRFRAYTRLHVDRVAQANFLRGNVTIIRASGPGGTRLFAIEDVASTAGLRVGQALLYGTLDFGAGVFGGEGTLRYDSQSERRFERLQSPPPPSLTKRFRHNELIYQAQREADQGDFMNALSHLAEAVELDRDPEVGYLNSDEPALKRCSAMAQRVWARTLPTKTMSKLWAGGCQAN